MASTTRNITQAFLALSVLSPFILAGCDGYVPVPYYGMPYSNDRTAGSGIAYVKAKLMTERGPILKAQQPENKALVEPVVVQEAAKEVMPVVAKRVDAMPADKVFNNMQKK